MSDEESFTSGDSSMTATDVMMSSSSDEDEHDVVMKRAVRYFNPKTSKRTRNSNEDNDVIYGRSNKPQTSSTAIHFPTKAELIKHVRETYGQKSTCIPQHPKKQPSNIVNCTLKDHQLLGVDWMLGLFEKSIGGILGDDMGVGKTLQAIATVASLIQTSKVTERNPALILVPLSVVPGWVKEFERFAPTLEVLSYVGDKNHRQNVRDGISDTLNQTNAPKDSIYLPGHSVLITTPELLRQDDYFVSKFDYSLVIIDEGHRYKSPKSAEIFNCTKKGNGLGHVPVRILLTGTPLQNNTEELWSLLNVVHPKGFAYSPMKGGHLEVTDADYRDSLIPYMILRRLKKDCLTLPSKKELVLHCPMSPAQQILYKSILMKNAQLVLDAAAGEKARGAGLSNTVMQLRKTSGHPYLFEGVEEEPFTMEEHLVLNSGKLVLLDKLLSHLSSIGSRALIFSQFTSVLDILQDYMHLREYSYERLDGSCRAADRQAAITNFSDEDSSVFVFLLSTRAGGLGLNLTAANSVIFFDHDWNPHVDLQAQERVYRIGQTQEVIVYRLLTAGTIEDLMLSRAVKKLELSDKLTGGENAAKDAKLTNNELLDFVLSAAATSSEDEEPSLDIRKAILHKPDDAPELFANFLKADISHILARAKLVSYKTHDTVEAVSENQQHLVYQGVDYSEKQKDGELLFQKLLKQAKEEEAKEGDDDNDGDQQTKQPVAVRTAEQKENDRRSRLEKRWEKASYTSRQLEPVPNYPNDALDAMFASYSKNQSNQDTEDSQFPSIEPDLSLSDGKHHISGDITHPTRLWRYASEKLAVDVGEQPPKTFDIIVQCVNNNGSWGSRGVFAALDRISSHIGSTYEKAKDCSDIRYGDVHLIKVKRLAAVALLVAMKDDQINHQLLEKSLAKLRSACSRIFKKGFYPVLHLSHFGNPKIWYGIEKVFTKFLSNVPTFVYYYNKRREEQKRKRHKDKKILKRKESNQLPPPPPPPADE
eukprot:TRINITY_DN752_c3_g1_i1.p1 TRINITY_DN752_c3_g1~~TRINITY_DN752_c3_g1_i1.p1  ORF type:complete len:1007 (+),score=217.61 TRINITY_DN752_c3_g1_i1:63-3023(+)